jgi:hypothetical protein
LSSVYNFPHLRFGIIEVPRVLLKKSRIHEQDIVQTISIPSLASHEYIFAMLFVKRKEK